MLQSDSAGIIAAFCRRAIPPSNRSAAALALPCTVQVSQKYSVISSLQLCIFSLFSHSLQFFFVSVLLRESFARILLLSLVATLSYSLSPFFCRYVALSVCVFVVSSLFFLSVRASIPVPIILYHFVCLFSRPSDHHHLSFLTFHSSNYPDLPFLLPFSLFIRSYIPQLNDTLLHRTSATPSLYTYVALSFRPSILPTLHSVVPPFSRRSFPTSFCPSAALFLLLSVHFLLCLSVPKSFGSSFATPCRPFVPRLLPPFILSLIRYCVSPLFYVLYHCFSVSSCLGLFVLLSWSHRPSITLHLRLSISLHEKLFAI